MASGLRGRQARHESAPALPSLPKREAYEGADPEQRYAVGVDVRLDGERGKHVSAAKMAGALTQAQMQPDLGRERGPKAWRQRERRTRSEQEPGSVVVSEGIAITPVSYTHLTLPTNREV